MAICKDKSLTYLNGLGYNVVRLPRKGIEPLDVLGRDGNSVERLGRLDEIWSSQAAMPNPGAPQSAAAVEGQKSSDLKLSVGLKMLSSALGAMGAAMPELSFAYNSADSIQFSFSNVKSVSVDPFALGNFLAAGDLRSNNPFVVRYFHDDDTEAYVITDVLKSDQISVIAKASNGTEVAVDIPAIQQAVGAKVSVVTSGTSSTGVSYKGQDLVTFGFKVFAIAFEDGAWKIQGVEPSGALAFAVPAGQVGMDPILLRTKGTVVLR